MAYIYAMDTIKILGEFSLSITVFLVSLRLMSNSVQAMLGSRLQKVLQLLTYNPLIAMLTGTVVTATIQSSSAVAAIMVAFVNAGILTIKQAFGVILGANIGTTITAQIAAFDLSAFFVPIMLSGLFLLPWNRRSSFIGSALVGLGGLFVGMRLLKLALVPILAHSLIQALLIELSDHIIYAVLVGMVVTALVQSSSAVTSVVIVLGQIGAISLVGAIAIALGSNIGTVITSLISSIGMTKESKATAYADLVFNVFGVLLILPVIRLFAGFVALTAPDLGRQIANAHTLFNLISAFGALILIGPLTVVVKKMAGIN